MILRVEDDHSGHADDFESSLLRHLGQSLRLDLQKRAVSKQLLSRPAL